MKGLTKVIVALFAIRTAVSAQGAEPVLVDLKKYGFSNPTDFQNYMTVSDMTITEVPVDLLAAEHFFAARAPAPNPADVLGDLAAVATDPSSITAWVTLGKKVWEIVVANKPVVNVSTQKVSILPQAQTDWRLMSNWNPRPFAKTYVIEARNGYGMKVIKHAYTVAFNYGGKYNGRGAFLANATIIPSQIEVAWGYKLNSKVQVGEAVNTGDLDSPIPGINLELQYKIDTVIKHSSGRDNFFVMGNGRVEHLTR
ncbi:MAG: hypothetical protein AAB250_16210 [Bdellovibrionota bacterium]